MEMLRQLIGPDDGHATAPQLCARAVILFFYGLTCIRVAGRKTFSQASPLDIIVAIVVGSNISRAMTGHAPFLPTLTATLALVALHRVFAMLTLRWSPLALMVKARATRLVVEGSPDEAALRRHGISRDDLMEALRLEQVEHLEDVRLATLEASGKISVIRRNAGR